MAAAIATGCAGAPAPGDAAVAPIVEAGSRSSAVIDDPDAAALVALTDPAFDPCADFYEFACHQTREMSAEDTMYYALHDAMRPWMTAGDSDDADAVAIRAAMAACLSRDVRRDAEWRGLEPLRASVDAVEDPASFMRAAGTLTASGVFSLLKLRSFPANGGPYVPMLYAPAGVAPPNDDAEASVVVEAIARSLDSIGGDATQATAVARFESALRRALPQDAPLVAMSEWTQPQWQPFIRALGQTLPKAGVVGDGGYLQAVPGLVKSTPAPVLRAYLLHRTREALGWDAPPSAWGEAEPPYGLPDQCGAELERRYTLFLARAYGRESLGEAGRARATAIVQRVRDVAIARVAARPWVSSELAAGVVAAANALSVRVGWLDQPYGALPSISASDHLANALAMRRWATTAALDGDFDPAGGVGWEEAQFLATAWNDPYNHTLDIGLGLLVPPIFDPERPLWLDAATLGGIAAHEVHHSWGPAHLSDHLEHLQVDPTLAAPMDAAQGCLQDAYAEAGMSLPFSDLEETIADIGGFSVGLEAFRDTLPSPPPSAGGLGPDALYFVGVSRLFCAPPTDADQTSDPSAKRRAYARARINAAVAASPAFAKAFSCEPGEPMRIDHACQTW